MLDVRPKILVIGENGQVARALARGGSRTAFEIVCAGRGSVDISNGGTLKALFRTHTPALVVNAAAYTAVDRAESDQAAAFAVNAEGPLNLARLCRQRDVPLVHFSTDYVFDGTAHAPYRETDPIAPLGVYGASKAAGEEAVRSTWARHLIVRTAWVYSNDGQNFLRTMLRLGAERREIGVVDDQRGSPTFAQDLADAILKLAPRLIAHRSDVAWGTYHLTGEGQATWYEFAAEIFGFSAAAGGLSPCLKPISTEEYRTSARRPAYSVLDTSLFQRNFGFALPQWRTSLAGCIALGRSTVRALEAHPS